MCKLLIDQYSRMFYYDFYEEVCYGGGSDFLDLTYNLVENEEDVDELFNDKKNLWRKFGRIPFIYMSENAEVFVFEKASVLEENKGEF